ncbi:hypothetical protein [Janthinobacterium sp. RB2R34]|uniref:hypothetical protein n=1 Tax=Janthinobacterium sp. RB2R34 TaxID=3424193 RepID=UPI003F23410D
MSIHPAQRNFMIGHRHQGWRIAAITILHLAVFWAATRPVYTSMAPDRRVWIQLVQPQQPAMTPPAILAPGPAAPALPARARETPSASAPVSATAPAPAATGTPDQPDKPEENTQPAPQTPSTAVPTLAQQALQAVGAIDRQLRKEHPQEFVAPPDTPQARLAKGFEEAHAAVRPKWHEAARIELWSAPNDPKRIYRVITSSGEYCIYMPDKGSMSLNLSARSGYAGFGGGTAAPCPIRF